MSEKDSSGSRSPSAEKPVAAKTDEEPTIAQDLVVTKYSMAADIVNQTLKELVAKCVPDQSVLELCEIGDKLLNERTAKVFKKEKEMKKGIAFPTCVSVNHCVCHYSPLRSETGLKLKENDLVKIDLGAHVDGFIATCAHSIVVGASPEKPGVDRRADVVLAAYNALQASIRMLRPEAKHTNLEITDAVQRVAASYECKPVENMVSYQLNRNQIGNDDDEKAKQIVMNPSDDQRQKTKKYEFSNFEVYALDILISTGEGKSREQDTRTTVFKRKDEIIYQLKMKASRLFLSEADKRCGMMPFSLRMFEDEVKAKMGVVECERHGLMLPFKVYYEREGEFVSQFKSTVLILPSGLLKITGLPLDETAYKSAHSIEDKTLKQLISMSLKPSKNKKNKKGSSPSGNEVSSTLRNGVVA